MKAVLVASKDVAKATWVLVGITAALVVVGLIVGVLQTLVMRGSVEAAKAIANLERPWILATLTEDNDVNGTIRRRNFDEASADAEMQAPPLLDRRVDIQISLVNRGRSPAWIIEEVFKFRVMPLPLPAEPPYGKPHTLNRIPMTPEEPPSARRLSRGVADNVVRDLRTLPHNAYCLVAFGMVRYIIASDDTPRETRFCWTWFNSGEPFGPPNWTDHT